MQTSEFLNAISDPLTLERKDLGELQRIVKDFPYFQSAHLLLSLGAKKWDASIYQQSIKRTAIVVPDRTRLFWLLGRLEQTPELKQELPKTQPAAEPEELTQLKLVENEVASTESAAVTELSGTVNLADQALENAVESEIARHVVNAFVEKEIIRTPELHKSVQEHKPGEPESFGDWLNFLKKNNGQPYHQIEEEVNRAREKKEAMKEESGDAAQPDIRRQRKMELIDKIIEKNPGLIRTREDQKFYQPDLKAKESLLENEHLVTETLARIYALQGSVNKAIRAYEILSLKYPQKSAYFASLIQKLKSNQ